MTDYAYRVGTAVQVTELGSHEGELELPEGTRGVVLEIIENDGGFDQAEVDFGQYGVHVTYDDQVALAEEPATKEYASGGVVLSPESMGLLEKAIVSPLDATDPNHYKFPGGAEVRHISEWLTANAAQALQYIARSSRIDGQNKGDAREDLRKAIRFLEFELERLDV